MIWSHDPLRLSLLAGMSCCYALVCLAPYLRVRRKRRSAEQARLALAHTPAWLVAYASQTGNCEELAAQTAATLQLAGLPVRLAALDQVSRDDLERSARLLLLVSTYGEGDAPDNAAAFVSRVMGAAAPAPDLSRLHYAVLALGDSAYSQFCGFGRGLDQWLSRQGAAALFPRVEVDRSAAAAIAGWRQQLSHLAGTSDAPDWSAPAFADWRLAERRLLNPGSAGAPVYHLELECVGDVARGNAPAGATRAGRLLAGATPAGETPAVGTHAGGTLAGGTLAGGTPAWASGDLAQIAVPADPDHPRDYSIASIPADGRVHLLVRLQRHADGSAGLASGWLTGTADIGATIQLRLRRHPRFRLEGNAERPLILIGNGSGIAGLRGHLRARAAAAEGRNWLVFGERNAAFDAFYHDELEQWRSDGVLARLDLVFSRDQPERLYVQDCVLAEAATVRTWLADGAAIYVCGSLEGMAGGVDRALEQIIGRPALDALGAAGRYRRDVY